MNAQRSTLNVQVIDKVYSRDEANALDDDTLRAAPVFRHNPDEMFSSNIVKSVQNNLLARGIPELSYPIGYTSLSTSNCVESIDMHMEFRRDDEAWPQRSIVYGDGQNAWLRWLHTDLINLPHYYTLESGEFAMSSWVARERIPPLAGCSLARQRSAFSIAPR